MKNILITGAGSYIGTNIKRHLGKYPDRYRVETVSVRGPQWAACDFSEFDAVVNVAGVAHVKETEGNRHLFYEVNRDLAIAIAKKARGSGVGQYILCSSMSVYGKPSGTITKETAPEPVSHYGKSKLAADRAVLEMDSPGFRVAVLRPPMVYGRGCKGNYRALRKLALTLPVFPDVNNERSMIYVRNLAEFVRRVIDGGGSGVFFPQNAEYVNTADMAVKIAGCHGKKLGRTGALNPVIAIGRKAGIGILDKAFGSLVYEKCDTVDLVDFARSIEETEG